MLLLILVGFFAVVCMRINMGIAMTCMINSTAVAMIQTETQMFPINDSISNITTTPIIVVTTKHKIESENEIGKCSKKKDNGDQPTVNDYGGTLIWSPSVQGWIFSSAFYGSLLTILPSGYLADTQSPKFLLTIAVICYVSGTALTPVIAVHGGWIPLFFDRVVMGMGDGIAIPAINKLVTFWIPIEEKSTAATIYTSGFSLASVIGIPVFAYLCSTSFGWPAIFYSCAIFGGIWAVLWYFLSSKSPHDCKYMTERERRYLLSKPELRKQTKSEKLQIPFKKIFTSPAFLSLVGCAFTANIISTFVHIYLPTFYKEVLFLPPVYNGIFGAVPPICEIIFKFLLSILMDALKQKKIISPTTAVKISQFLSGLFITILFIAIGYVATCDRPYVTLSLFCGVAMAMSATAPGFFTSMLSIAPAFTGIISSSTFVIGISARVITPFVVPFFIKTGTLEEWRPIFFIIAGTSVVSTVFFMLFGSGECQEWARNPYGTSSTELEEVQKMNEIDIGSVATLNLI